MEENKTADMLMVNIRIIIFKLGPHLFAYANPQLKCFVIKISYIDLKKKKH